MKLLDKKSQLRTIISLLLVAALFYFFVLAGTGNEVSISIPENKIINETMINESTNSEPIITEPVITEPIITEPIVTDPTIITAPGTTEPKIHLQNKLGEEQGTYELQKISGGNEIEEKYNLELSSLKAAQKSALGTSSTTEETTVSIFGLKNPPANLTAKIDTYDGEEPASGIIKTPVFAIEEVEIANATIRLPKLSKIGANSYSINKIFRCT